MAKALFLHIPKSASEPSIKFMPLGTIALANFLNNKGHDTKIANIYVEKQLNPNFSITDYAKSSGAKIFCLPLHWHFQAYDVIEAAKNLKKEIPDCKIILGGFTATYFADEILEKFDCIDMVIKGDSEIPLLNIMENKDLKEIPNLVWRKENKIFINPQTYKLEKEILDSLSFTDFEIIEHFNEYKKLGIAGKDAENKWLFVYNPGIGCPVNCSYCGGSCSSQQSLNTRESPMFIRPTKAIYELKRLAENSMGVWYVCFDPDPERDYYLELFRMLREEKLESKIPNSRNEVSRKIKVRCKFEAWSLPTREFINSFSETFEKGSEILLSPDTGSENIRKFNKGFFYTNEALLNSVRYMEEKDITCRLYFTAGLPKETMDDFTQTLLLINNLRINFKNTAINAVPIEIEPASPMFLDNEKYKITTKRKTILDFYNEHKQRSSIGYETEFFKKDEIPELVNLARAAAECVMKRPVFEKVLSEKKIPAGDIPVNELWKFCLICKFSGRCFG